jgi:molecular chaperone GrpE
LAGALKIRPALQIPPSGTSLLPVDPYSINFGAFWTDSRNSLSPMNESEPEMGKPPKDEAAEPLLRVEPEPLTPEQIDELKSLAAKADEHWDRLLRTTADFENFRKRAAREKQEALRYANEGLIAKLMPVLDGFDLALAAARTGAPGADSAQSLSTGVAMVYQQLKSALAEAGLEEIDALGQPFDPRWHEAVSQTETAEAPEGQVLQQIRKGYKLRDRLLRPAVVIVAKAPAA